MLSAAEIPAGTHPMPTDSRSGSVAARAQRIRLARRALGLTSSQLADMLGEDRSAWAKVEKGRRPISLRQLELLCSRTEASADYILFGDASALPFDFRLRLLERENPTEPSP